MVLNWSLIPHGDEVDHLQISQVSEYVAGAPPAVAQGHSAVALCRAGVKYRRRAGQSFGRKGSSVLVCSRSLAGCATRHISRLAKCVQTKPHEGCMAALKGPYTSKARCNHA